ncbi:MAG TPA: hypothetical protein VHY20_02745 [Pirellulales bacterium]|nr:hypothetical protein [Pirellulales bacterium]
MWRNMLCAIVLASTWAASPARADDAALEGIYGSGVEAYYTGDYVRAFDLLNSAVQAGSHDPRVYYFRGLAQTFLGRAPDAQRDFQKGAQLESSETAGVVDVGRSLERVQGPTRLLLERYRSAARLASVAERERQRILRYGHVRPAPPMAAAAAAGQQAAGAAAEEAAPAAAPPAEKAAGEDPFAAPPAKEPAAPPADDPFAAPPAKAPEAPPADDPFAAPK